MTGLDNLHTFELGTGGFCGGNGPKWLSVKTVRGVYADTNTSVFFLVIEFTPKKTDRIGPLFDGSARMKWSHGPVWHVLRWDYVAFRDKMRTDPIYRRRGDGELVDLAVQMAQNDGLGAVHGMKPVGIGPWPKRAMALMALCDIATRERAEYEKMMDAAWEQSQDEYAAP